MNNALLFLRLTRMRRNVGLFRATPGPPPSVRREHQIARRLGL